MEVVKITDELIYKAQKGDQWAKNEVVKANMGLVNKVVRAVTGEQDEDLISIGYRGLLMAIDQYKPNPKAGFTTLAFYKIKGVISNEFENRRKHKRCIHYGEPMHSLEAPMTERDSEGTEDMLYETIATNNGEEHGFAHIFEEENSTILSAYKKLDEEQQLLFELKYIQEIKSNEKLAKILNCKKSKVDYQIRRLKRDLNDIMGLDYEVSGIKSVRKQKRYKGTC